MEERSKEDDIVNLLNETSVYGLENEAIRDVITEYFCSPLSDSETESVSDSCDSNSDTEDIDSNVTDSLASKDVSMGDISGTDDDLEDFVCLQDSTVLENHVMLNVDEKLDLQFIDDDFEARKCHCVCKMWENGSCLNQFTVEEQQTIR
jgi:hypothetical protein